MFSGALYFVCTAKCHWASQVAQWLRIHLPMQEVRVQSLGGEDPLEEEMATSSSILAWKIPWTEEAGGLQSTGLQRVGHDWATEHRFAIKQSTMTLGGLFICLFFWLILVAVCRLSLVAASRGCSSLPRAGFSLRWLLLLQSTDSKGRPSVVAARGLSSFAARA